MIVSPLLIKKNRFAFVLVFNEYLTSSMLLQRIDYIKHLHNPTQSCTTQNLPGSQLSQNQSAF